MKIKHLAIPIVFLFGFIAFLPPARAVLPAPDGGYPGGNTAEGQSALLSLTTGGFNTAVGLLSLRSDTSGQLNTAIGAGTLLASTADENTATGAGALLSNTIGDSNTANGAFALFSNTSGSGNTALGFEALLSGVGAFNTAVGFSALKNNTTGSGNIALGDGAGLDHTTGNGNIYIASRGVPDESDTMRIGNPVVQTRAFIAGVRGVTTVNAAIPVLIDTVGQLGTISSSRRFKKEIKPMDQASGAILGLKPVTFHYKSDTAGTPQFGLIAEEVAEVNPDLVVRDEKGEIYTVRYEAVNAMLLNEFLKEHKKVEQLQATVTRLATTVEEQAAQIQKVNAKIELNGAASQVAAGNQ